MTVRRATTLIFTLTLVVTVGAGIAIWLVDHSEFPNLGTSLWWAVQTVTTVGYGDVVPEQTGGRLIGTLVMLNGIGFITVMTAALTAMLIEQARRRQRAVLEGAVDGDVPAQLHRIEARLAAIEDALAVDGRPSRSAPGAREDDRS